MTAESPYYLPEGLPIPVPETDDLSAPYWEGAKSEKLMVQRCNDCGSWPWGPEWICHRCLSFDMGWEEIEPVGRIYSWERSHHPVHVALKGHGATVRYVTLPHESHGYAARESVLHTVAEMLNWANAHLKKAGTASGTSAAR